MLHSEKSARLHSSHAPSQRARQLDAIESALQRIVHRLHHGDAANDISHNSLEPLFIIQRGADAIQLLVTASQKNKKPCSLRVAAVFPGSHSQTEVMIGIKQRENNPEQRLEPSPLPTTTTTPPPPPPPLPEVRDSTTAHLLNPRCHYIQFSNYTDKTYACFDRDSINMVMILPDDRSLIHDAQLDKLEAQPLFHLAKLITVITLGQPANDLAPRSLTAQNRLLRPFAERCAGMNVVTRYIQLDEDDSLGLLHALSQHDIAILPTPGLAVDALNVGCLSAIWNGAGCYSLCADEKVDLPEYIDQNSSVIQLRRSLKNIAARQRTVFLNQQLKRSGGILVTTRFQQLACVVESFATGACRESADDTQKLRIPTLNNRADDRSIIPQASQHRADTSIAWASAYDRARRKLRKLHRSPNQFLSDSQFPILRSLSARHHKIIK